jgi:hypothetical protein
LQPGRAARCRGQPGTKRIEAKLHGGGLIQGVLDAADDLLAAQQRSVTC